MAVVVITGGSRGIGAAAVEAFAARGDRVYFLYEKEHEAAASVAQKTGATAICCDVADGQAAGSVELNWHLGPDSNVAYTRSGNAYECKTGYGDGNNMVFKTFCFNGTVANSSFLAETGKSWYSDAIYVKEERPCHQVAVTKSDEQQVRFVTVIYPFSDTVPDITAMFNSSDMITVLTGDKYYLLYL